MNNQIKELATKAGFWTTDKFCEGETAKYLENFAEFIVSECLSETQRRMSTGECWSVAECQVKAHFGINK